MSSQSRSEGGELVYIGQFPPAYYDSQTREKLAVRCAELHHPNSKCEQAHTGGTHSLGPIWGNPSKYTARDGLVKRKKEDDDAVWVG